ncbi:MAG: hypothetical protein WCT85_01690 [Parachlamydiales bacterium]|jgi:hypothetical protein
MSSILGDINNFVMKNSGLASGAAICSIASFELTIRTINNVCFVQNPDKNVISRDLAGALLYGICAFNPFPYSLFLGTLVFIGHSLISPDNYFSSKIIRKILEKTSELISKIAEVTRKVFTVIFEVVSLPENPLWYLVGGVIVLSGFYLGLPNFFLNR